VEINSTEKGEEFDSVFRELGEVLIDHLQGAFENIFHDRRYLVLHKSLGK
jgi:hypothetical protein